jgi:hypothetical protein
MPPKTLGSKNHLRFRIDYDSFNLTVQRGEGEISG